MKKQLVILVMLMSCSFIAQAQTDTSFKLVRIISGDIVDFTVDNLDNIYVLNSRNQVKKLNANGDSMAVFNDVKKFGKASLIDVSNPLKILLYYPDFATVVMLDRFLNVVNTIDLRKNGILQAKAIGLSYDNKVWVYDEVENKLKKVALKNKIQISRWNNFKVTGKYIFGATGDILHRYELASFRLDDWRMPEQIYKSRAFNFSAARLYALKKDSIEIYSWR
jgi:hypothetical protein